MTVQKNCLQTVSILRLILKLQIRSSQLHTSSKGQVKLLYEGSLSNRILYLKSLSVLSSLGLASSYGYVISQKGLSVALAGVGIAFTPFLLSPFVIAWFFKRYITHLYYDPATKTFTAHHYGLLLNKRSVSFKKEDLIRSDVTSMLNTFKVGKKPFYLHDEDLKDLDSIELYREMVGLDKIKRAD